MSNIELADDFHRQVASVDETWAWKPTFLVVVDARAGCSEDLASSICSVEEQVYPHRLLTVVSDQDDPDTESSLPSGKTAASWAEALCERTADFIVSVRTGDRLAPWALFHFAKALQKEPSATIVYGDEDEIDDTGCRRKPWFKPSWNEELFLARDYLSGACAMRASAICDAASKIDPDLPFPSFELLLHSIRREEGPIVHVPQIVTHASPSNRHSDQSANVDAIGRYVACNGGKVAAGPFGSVKITWPLPEDLPLVSIIVPTKDKQALLRACVESVLTRTAYKPFELLIMDNESADRGAIAYLDSLRGDERVRVLRYPHAYNFSAINNEAARQATGSYLCLLNNDTEVIEEDWLAEMMRYAVRPNVGAVGAKLLYDDRRIQHAGVVVGIGEAAGHAHRFLPAQEIGYFAQAHLPQYVSAVTGACLLVEKRKFLAVGGLDEVSLAIAFNDVDFCLKLERNGWRNVYVPHAVLTHHESKSRGKDYSPRQIDRYRRELKVFQDRWGAKTYSDPLFNPNLDPSSETFVVRF
jgi:GT2 family glycosyltransferase